MTPSPFWILPAVTRDRVTALQTWLDERGFDAYVVTGVENAAYLSGWKPDVEPWERPIAMIVPRRGNGALVLHELSVHGVRMARERGTLVVDDVAFYVERPDRLRRPPRVPERGRGHRPGRAVHGRPLAADRRPRCQGARRARPDDLPEDMAFNERPLRAGEVYTIEPGIYLWGVGGFRVDDTVVVGEPPLVLTATPRDLDAVTLPG